MDLGRTSQPLHHRGLYASTSTRLDPSVLSLNPTRNPQTYPGGHWVLRNSLGHRPFRLVAGWSGASLRSPYMRIALPTLVLPYSGAWPLARPLHPLEEGLAADEGQTKAHNSSKISHTGMVGWLRAVRNAEIWERTQTIPGSFPPSSGRKIRTGCYVRRPGRHPHRRLASRTRNKIHQQVKLRIPVTWERKRGGGRVNPSVFTRYDVAQIGRALVSTHDYRRAGEYYRKALRGQPRSIPLRHDLARLCLKLSRFEDASAVLRQVWGVAQ